MISEESYDGHIVAVLPAAKNEGNPLWHMKYDADDDSEDLDEGNSKSSLSCSCTFVSLLAIDVILPL